MSLIVIRYFLFWLCAGGIIANLSIMRTPQYAQGHLARALIAIVVIIVAPAVCGAAIITNIARAIAGRP